MNLATLAEALGLPKDSPQDKVFSRLLEERKEGAAVKESFSKLTGELSAFGLKLDQDKLVKLDESFVTSEALAVKPGDDPEAAAIKKELAERRQKDALSRMATIKSGVEKLIAEGRITPATREVLTLACSIPEKATVLALSSDGTELVSRVASNLGQELLKALGSMPRMTLPATGLARQASEPLIPPAVTQKDPEALASRGREAAAKVSRSSKTYKEKQAAKK